MVKINDIVDGHVPIEAPGNIVAWAVKLAEILETLEETAERGRAISAELSRELQRLHKEGGEKAGAVVTVGLLAVLAMPDVHKLRRVRKDLERLTPQIRSLTCSTPASRG